MPNRSRPTPTPKELPPCQGPKLGLFKHHKSKIKWLERLDNNQDENSSTEGYVFRAMVRDRAYAIKVFKFHDPMHDERFWGPLIGDEYPLQTVSYYTDPFYAECRAYGRIHEATKNKMLRQEVAIPCHGYLFLQKRDEAILESRNVDLELGMVDPDFQLASLGGCRARAIVKDLAPPNTGVVEKSLPKIASGIASLNNQQVYNMDIRLDNYRDGKLVDFGSSWTEPHILLYASDRFSASEHKLADRVMFEEMVEDEKIPNPKGIRMMHHMSLRSDITNAQAGE